MASSLSSMRPLSCLKSVFREARRQNVAQRTYKTLTAAQRIQAGLPKDLPEAFWAQLPPAMRPSTPIRPIKAYPSLPSVTNVCREPLVDYNASQIALLDPTGARQRLFSRKNPDSARVGDILMATFKTGEPFAGVCINIRHRGVDTAMLLRNELTRVGCEMWIKIYSPNVQRVEVVQRAQKRVRRAKLYFMRQPKHHFGSVQNIVDRYLREKALLQGGSRGRNAKKGGSKGKSR